MMDWRTPAVEETWRLLAAQPAGTEPDLAGLSLCLPVGDEGMRRVWRATAAIAVGSLLLGFALLGGAVLMLEYVHLTGDDLIDGLIALLFTVAGIAMFFLGAVAVRWPMRRHFRRSGRWAELTALGAAPQPVTVEDPATAQKMKLLGDDVGYLVLEPELARVRIEGLSHRYVINGEDVVSLEMYAMPSARGVLLRYRVGEADLGLVVAPQVDWGGALAAQTGGTGSPSPLLRPLRDALRLVPAAGAPMAG